jgi:acetylornithine/succinyldiaminopimelate/putrescine aminotransferase
VARAALRVLVEEGMIENAAAQGTRFLDGLSGIRSNTIREVRGRGLMLAVELHPEQAVHVATVRPCRPEASSPRTHMGTRFASPRR